MASQNDQAVESSKADQKVLEPNQEEKENDDSDDDAGDDHFVTKEPSTGKRLGSFKRQRPQSNDIAAQKKPKAVYAHKLVRTDHRSTTLDLFFDASGKSRETDDFEPTATDSSALVDNTSTSPEDADAQNGSDLTGACVCGAAPTTASTAIGAFANKCGCCGGVNGARRERSGGKNDIKITQTMRALPLKETECEYQSIKELLEDIRERKHPGLEVMLKQHTFVGVVDATYMLVQYGTKLLMIDHADMSKELFYQLALRRFGCAGRLKLTSGVNIREYIRAALDSTDAQWTPEDGPKDVVAENIVNLLLSKAEMLNEYFNMEITASGELTSLPELLDGHRPIPELLPLYLLRLATEVNWAEEKACFESVATILGLYYAQLPMGGDAHCQVEAEGSSHNDWLGRRLLNDKAINVLQYQILPGLKTHLMPPTDFADNGTVVQVAALEQLAELLYVYGKGVPYERKPRRPGFFSGRSRDDAPPLLRRTSDSATGHLTESNARQNQGPMPPSIVLPGVTMELIEADGKQLSRTPSMWQMSTQADDNESVEQVEMIRQTGHHNAILVIMFVICLVATMLLISYIES